MRATEVLNTAYALVSGERNAQHGDMEKNLSAIATMWTATLAIAGKTPAVPLDAHDVANMMECLKVARRYSGAFNPDDYIDGAGYAAIACQMKAGK